MMHLTYPHWQATFSSRESREGFFADTSNADSVLQSMGLISSTVSDADKLKREREEREKIQLAQRQREIQKCAEGILKDPRDERTRRRLRGFTSDEVKAVIEGESRFGHEQRKRILETLQNTEQQDFLPAFQRLTDPLTTHKQAKDWETFMSLPPSKALGHLKNAKERANYFALFATFLQDSRRVKSPQAFLFLRHIQSDANKGDFWNTLRDDEVRMLTSFRTELEQQHTFFVLDSEVREAQAKTQYAAQEIRERSTEMASEDTEVLNKEMEMQKLIEARLGPEIAKRAMEARERENTELNKNRAMFRIIEEGERKILAESERKTLPEIFGVVKGSQAFYTALFKLSNIKESEKRKQLTKIQVYYQVLTDKLSALQGGDAIKYARKLHALGILPKENLKEIEYIENWRREMAHEARTLANRFYERRIELIAARRAWDGRPESMEALYPQFCREGKFPLSEEDLRAFFNGRDDSVLEPLRFKDIRTFERKYEFDDGIHISPVPEMMRNPEQIEHRGVEEWTIARLLPGQKEPAPAVVKFFRSPNKEPRYISESREVIKDLVEMEVEMNAMLEADLGSISVEQQIAEMYNEAFDPEKVRSVYSEVQNDLFTIADILQEGMVGLPEGASERRGVENATKGILTHTENLVPPTQKELSAQRAKVDEQIEQQKGRYGDELSYTMLNKIRTGLEIYSVKNYAEQVREMRERLQIERNAGTLANFLRTEYTPPSPPPLSRPTNIKKAEDEIPLRSEIAEAVPSIILALRSGQPIPKEILSLQKPNGKMLFQSYPLKKWRNDISQEGFIFNARTETIYLREDRYNAILSGENSDWSSFRGLGHELGHLVAKYAKGPDVGVDGFKKFVLADPTLKPLAEKIIGRDFLVQDPNAHKWEELWASCLAGNNEDPEMANFLSYFSGNTAFQSLVDRSLEAFKRGYQKDHFAVPEGEELMEPAGVGLGTLAPETGDPMNHILTGDHLEYWTNRIISTQKSNREKLEEFLKDVKHPKGIEYGNALLKYLDGELERFLANPTEAIAEEILKNHDGKVGQFTKDVDLLTKEVSDETAKYEEQQGYFTALWKGTTFLSTKDLGRMWDTFVEYLKRKHETKSKRRVGMAGNAVFSGIIDQLANDFDREKEAAEMDEVDKYKKSLENKDAWQVYDFIEKSRHQDELKAALRVLADKGRLDWNNEIIWDALTRFSGVRFYKSDRYNQPLRNSKLQRASERIWDAGEYRDLETTNQSKIEGQVKKFEKEADSYMNKLPPQLDQMLKDQHDKAVKVDPHRYEAFTCHLATGGKGNPEDLFFYTVAGISSGILTPERGIAIQKRFTNDYPYLQIIDQMNPDQGQYNAWMDQIREIARRKGKKMEKEDFWNPGAPIVKEFLYLNIAEEPGVRERIFANKSGDKWDHDHARLIASTGDASMAYSLTAGATGGNARFKTTIYNNIQVGILDHITTLARNRDKMSDSQLRKVIARQAGYAIYMDGILRGRVHTDKNATYQFRDNELKTAPREGGAYKAGMKTVEYMDRNCKIFGAIPALQEFFKILTDNQNKGKAGEAVTATKLMGKYDDKDKTKLIEPGIFERDAFLKKALSDIGEPAPRSAKEGFDLIQPLVEYCLDATKVGEDIANANLNAILNTAEQVKSEDEKRK